MSRYYDEKQQDLYWGIFLRDLAIVVIVAVILGMGGCPHYTVWQQGLAGQAELKRAEQNRQIKVQEATAQEEAAKHLAQAEIARAHGVAEANKIIGQSLHNNEAYLRYLWIHSLETTKSQVIYVPTEANLPILEAGKRSSREAK